MSGTTAWIPLESNPDVWNVYIKKLGVDQSHAFCDVYGFDEELLAFIPQPIKSLILLFPVTPVYEQARLDENSKIKADGQKVSSKVWFTKQTISNACGTIGLLHALLNGIPDHLQDGEPLKNLYEATKALSPGERAEFLKTGKEAEVVAKLHRETGYDGQTNAPSADEKVDLHFVAFVKSEDDGCLYELDGRKEFPINHGTCDNLLLDSIKVVKTFMARDPENVNFTTIALAPS